MKHRVAFISSILTIFLFLPTFITKVKAATPSDYWFIQGPQEYNTTLRTHPTTVFGEGFNGKTMSDMMNSLSFFTVGDQMADAGSPMSFQKSALGGIGNYMAMMYANPPADTIAFVRDMGQSLGFIPKSAYAQGVGFSGLAPLLGLWKAFRNIAYLLLAIVMIVIGFMVMFRKKIDPKTVVTVQNALPRIVITLLLVTFSYAIVGLLIDLMYLIILLAIAVIGGSGLKGIDIPGLQQLYTTGTGAGATFDLMGRVFSPLGGIVSGPGVAIGGTIGALGGAAAGLFTTAGALSGIGALIGGLVGSYVGASVGQPAGALSPLLYLLFALVLLFGFIRILFMLIMAYVQVILAVILGPVQILMEAIPGSNGFMSWLTNLLANLAAFPITVIMLVIGDVISQNISGAMWVPPLIPGGTEGIIRAIIGIGIILSIPSIFNSLKKSLKVQPAPISLGVGGAGATGLQILSTGVSIKQLTPQKIKEKFPKIF